MKVNHMSSSGPEDFSASAGELKTHCRAGSQGFMDARDACMTPRRHFTPSSCLVAHAVFGAIVAACLLAAAMLASNDVPLVLGGL